MNKKLLCILMCTFLTLNCGISVLATDELDDKKNQLENILSEIKELDNQIASLNDEIYNLEDKVNANENEIKDTEDEITANEIKIEKLESDIEQGEKTLSIRIREMYKNGSTNTLNMLSYIIESDGLSDFFSRINSINTIIKLDNKLIKENNEMIVSLNESTQSLNLKKQELDSLNNEIKTDLLAISEKQNLVVESKAKLDSERQSISAQIEEKELQLVSNSIAVATSLDSDISKLEQAIFDLNGLLPQITSSSVRSKITSAIEQATTRKEELQYEQSNNNNNNNNNSNNDNNNSNNDGSYIATYTMEATAYYGHGITASGTIPVRDPNGISTVAVDPTVIPLGTRLFIPGYGHAIATDTGGAIKGKKIDLYMNTREECYAFGRKNITVHIISYN